MALALICASLMGGCGRLVDSDSKAWEETMYEGVHIGMHETEIPEAIGDRKIYFHVRRNQKTDIYYIKRHGERDEKPYVSTARNDFFAKTGYVYPEEEVTHKAIVFHTGLQMAYIYIGPDGRITKIYVGGS